MAIDPEIAGFIVADRNGVILGSGETGAGALHDAKTNLGLDLWPATNSVLSKLGPWKVVDGIAMTDDEAPASSERDYIFRRFCKLQRDLIEQIDDDVVREEFEAALKRFEQGGGNAA